MCILGGGGFLGQSLAKELQRRGHYVVLLDLSYSMFHHIVLDPARMTQVKVSAKVTSTPISKFGYALDGTGLK